MEFIKKYKHESILFLILLLATILRFYNYAGWSLSNDELSALNRIRFDNFHDLIHSGVIPDVHPAGVQVFVYFWTKLFGISEASVRFPFAIAGILSVFISYLLTKKWINKTAALFVALSMCFLEYPVLYSQVARPYSLGLLFTLSSTLFWSLILFSSNKIKIRNYIGFILSASLATYSHYFSAFVVAMIGVTGFLFVKKTNWKQYIVSGLVIGILFIPHIKITILQFSYEGLGWLGKPDSYWFFSYLKYCFNDSFFLISTVLLILFTLLIQHFRIIVFSKFQIVTLLWFLFPFFTGYFYSIYKAPILQQSTLIFSFPFLLIFVFSFIPENLNLKIISMLSVLCIVGVYSTAYENKYYSTQHFGEFRVLAEKTIQWNNKYGSENITKTININVPYYIDYYFNKFSTKVPFVKYYFQEQSDLGDLIEIVKDSKTDYFIYGYSTVYNPAEIAEIIRDKYPEIVENCKLFNSNISLFKKNSEYQRNPAFKSFNDLEKEYPNWSWNPNNLDSVIFNSGKKSQALDEKNPYSSIFSIPCSELSCKDSCTITASANMYLTEGSSAVLSLMIERKDKPDEKIIYGISAEKQIKTIEKWGKVYLTLNLNSILNPDDILKIYVLNMGKSRINIDDIKICIYNP